MRKKSMVNSDRYSEVYILIFREGTADVRLPLFGDYAYKKSSSC